MVEEHTRKVRGEKWLRFMREEEWRFASDEEWRVSLCVEKNVTSPSVGSAAKCTETQIGQRPVAAKPLYCKILNWIITQLRPALNQVNLCTTCRFFALQKGNVEFRRRRCVKKGEEAVTSMRWEATKRSKCDWPSGKAKSTKKVPRRRMCHQSNPRVISLGRAQVCVVILGVCALPLSRRFWTGLIELLGWLRQVTAIGRSFLCFFR